MANSGLIVRRENSELMFDTRLMAYGLIKAGGVTPAGRWPRLQPTGGNSVYFDNIYEFRVSGALSPIVFVSGLCCKPFLSKVGNEHIFSFAGNVSDIKVYCFDLMRNIFTGAGLRTRTTENMVSFNSLQIPLNIIGESSPVSSGGPPRQPFARATFQWLVPGLLNTYNFQPSWTMTIPLNPNIEYAAHIPWNRGGFSVVQLQDQTAKMKQGVEEGCFGEKGSVSHIFAYSPRTTCGTVHSTTQTGVFSYVTAPVPSCPYINCGVLPYPFN